MSGTEDGTGRNLPEDDDRTRIAPTHGGTGGPRTFPDASDDEPTRIAGSDDEPTRIAGGDDEATRFVSAPDDGSAAPTRIASAEDGAEPTIIATPGAAPRPGGKLPIGTLINNNYRIDAVLKSGGMGEVYRGTEIHTDNPVAIKAILQERADDTEAGIMFKREASTLSRLSDETIVRYLNYVPDPDLQRYFLVMEFIEGVPLKDYIAENGALPPEHVITLLARLAKGLATAHRSEVIHRDLSPDNVMLAGGQVEDARLIDFGIAKSNVVTEGTIAGRFAGKFKYVAPEQLGHYGGTITPATDIYGLGLLIAAAAVGRPLDMGSSIVEAVQTRQSIPDLTAAPAQLRPILSHMLEPDPADRPASMLDVKAMAEDPSLIPPKYLGDWVPPATAARPAATFGPSSTFGPTQTGTLTPGLQTPGMTQPTQTWSGTQTGRGSIPPQTVTGTMGPATTPPAPAKSGGGAMPAILGLVVLAALGGGGYFAWSSGMLGGAPGAAAPAEEAAATGIPAPLTDTREGFLATLDTGPCTFVSRVAQGPNAGVIEGYSSSGERFAGLPTAYEEAFGARPEVLPREVTPDQCAALDFARALQGRGRNGIEMVLSADSVPSQTPVTAQLTVPSSQSVWLWLISPRGGVFNLTERLSQPVGNSRTTGFALALGAGVESAPQILLAVESDTPLGAAALIRNRDTAAEVLPKVLAEIAERDGAASASLSWLQLTQPVTEGDAAE